MNYLNVDLLNCKSSNKSIKEKHFTLETAKTLFQQSELKNQKLEDSRYYRNFCIEEKFLFRFAREKTKMEEARKPNFKQNQMRPNFFFVYDSYLLKRNFLFKSLVNLGLENLMSFNSLNFGRMSASKFQEKNLSVLNKENFLFEEFYVQTQNSYNGLTKKFPNLSSDVLLTKQHSWLIACCSNYTYRFLEILQTLNLEKKLESKNSDLNQIRLFSEAKKQNFFILKSGIEFYIVSLFFNLAFNFSYSLKSCEKLNRFGKLLPNNFMKQEFSDLFKKFWFSFLPTENFKKSSPTSEILKISEFFKHEFPSRERLHLPTLCIFKEIIPLKISNENIYKTVNADFLGFNSLKKPKFQTFWSFQNSQENSKVLLNHLFLFKHQKNIFKLVEESNHWFTLNFFEKNLRRSFFIPEIHKIDFFHFPLSLQIKGNRFQDLNFNLFLSNFLMKIKTFTKKYSSLSQEDFIQKLTPSFYAYSYYYQIYLNKETFSRIDKEIFILLWKWACRRHNNKSKKWIQLKYFYPLRPNFWIFGSYLMTTQKDKSESVIRFMYLPAFSQILFHLNQLNKSHYK